MVNPYTEKLHAADANLDRSFRALKYYIEAVQFRKDEGWKEAAAKMEATIRIYGWTANDFGYKAQIAAMLNIVKEFDDKFGTQIELIEALAWYTPFKTNLLELVNLYNESASYIPANDATIKDTRQPLVDSIRSLLQIIELMGQHNPSDEHTALEDAINEHITRSMASVKAAITRDANNKAEQEPETLQ